VIQSERPPIQEPNSPGEDRSFTMNTFNQGLRPATAAWLAPLLLIPVALLLAPAAQAHHLLDLLHLTPSPGAGFFSGLAHPVIGPDHLLFLLALSLVGLRHRASWMLGLLATGLAGSAFGLVIPGLPGAEALVSFTLVVMALVLMGRLPMAVLFPAFAVHGYVLSGSVIGWTTMPVAFYLLGLLLSQGALLLLSLNLLRPLAAGLRTPVQQWLAAALIGCGGAWTWSALVG
jgi:urease accessory protein